jgi:hypothetical protein
MEQIRVMSVLARIEARIGRMMCHKAATPVLPILKDSASWYGTPLHCGISILRPGLLAHSM